LTVQVFLLDTTKADYKSCNNAVTFFNVTFSKENRLVTLRAININC